MASSTAIHLEKGSRSAATTASPPAACQRKLGLFAPHAGLEHLVRDLKRLLEANWPACVVPADLKEDLVSEIVVRGAQQLGEDLRSGYATVGERRPALVLGHRSGGDVALHAAAAFAR